MLDNCYIYFLSLINICNNFIIDIFVLMEFLFLINFIIIFYLVKQFLLNTMFSLFYKKSSLNLSYLTINYTKFFNFIIFRSIV